ncbi:hypothetical protein [Maricaulis sp.]|uniref:alpha/beta hydrolase family protein n=1 Tax=unclassified Maricaulis TaxID=2632371 RepID=UPI001B1B6E6B|nr:hypothetical protein [Maricaulis sp.]MBO6798566.1 hypothetical protein [Maricaulis sp.]
MVQNIGVFACLAALLALVPMAQSDAGTLYDDHGPHTVETVLETWTDTAREREVPVKLYLPDGEGPFPVVIFSHGLAGSREAAPYLGEHWASHGFLGVFVQHPGTDRSLLEGMTSREEAISALRGRRDPASARARFEDIPFIIDELERRAAAGELAVDTNRLGLSGHSYGAATTIALLGRSFGPRGQFGDDRIDAGIALSPTAPPARLPARAHPRLYANMSTPMLHMTGTEDRAAVQPDIDPADRTIPFQLIPDGEQYLVVFQDGDHSVFGGRRRAPGGGAVPDWYPDVQAVTAEITTVFWQAHLNGDTDALAWLAGTGLDASVREHDRVERRNLD